MLVREVVMVALDKMVAQEKEDNPGSVETMVEMGNLEYKALSGDLDSVENVAKMADLEILAEMASQDNLVSVAPQVQEASLDKMDSGVMMGKMVDQDNVEILEQMAKMVEEELLVE